MLHVNLVLMLKGVGNPATLAATGAPSYFSIHLFHVGDNNTHIHFLIDTRSKVSIIPPSLLDRQLSPDKLTLTAVNNTPIQTFGKRSLTLDLGLQHPLPWVFVVADIPRPILGADFLCHYGLLVDIKRRQLLDTITQLWVQRILSTDTSLSPAIHTKDIRESVQQADS